MWPRVCLATARLTLTAWVGAAVLFVVIGVQTATSKDDNLNKSKVKDSLVLVRFPTYYAFGFTLVTISGIALLAGRNRLGLCGRRFRIAILLLAAGLAVMAADYIWIYSPLEKMITPPGSTRPARFVALHNASMYINATHIGLFLLAAIVICWPRSDMNIPKAHAAGNATRD